MTLCMRIPTGDMEMISERKKVRIKIAVITIVMTVTLCCLVTSCFRLGRKKPSEDDIYGWYELKIDKGHYVMSVQDDYIDVFFFKKDNENEETMSASERNIGYSYKICDIEVKGSRVIINAIEDYDRTEQGPAWHWTLSEELYDYIDEFEYSNNSIVNWHPNSSKGTYKRSEREHPLCEKILEDRKRCVETAKTAKPLELEEIKYFSEAKFGRDDIYFVAKITNPNPFRVYKPELLFYRSDKLNPLETAKVEWFIEAESTSIVVIEFYDESHGSGSDIFRDSVKCEINYNIYLIRFPGQENTYEVVSPGKVTLDDNGYVKNVLFETRCTYGNDRQLGDVMGEKFKLNMIFYKDDEIVGFGFDEFNLPNETRQRGIRYFTPIADYDRFEVYVS